jgi:hypothetical protein
VELLVDGSSAPPPGKQDEGDLDLDALLAAFGDEAGHGGPLARAA